MALLLRVFLIYAGDNCQQYNANNFHLVYHSLTFLNVVASSGDDYTIASSVLTFTPFSWNQTRNFTVQILPDTLVEYNETFEVNLGISAGYTALAQLGNPSKAILTILDDDSKLQPFQINAVLLLFFLRLRKRN